MVTIFSTFSLPHHFPPITLLPPQSSHLSLSSPSQNPNFLSLTPFSRQKNPITKKPLSTKSDNTNHSSSSTNTQADDGIPIDDVKTLVKFKSRYNYIRVLEVSRNTDHPFRGSRLLLLDGPGNIHSINFLYKTLTYTYFDVFGAFPPILPPGPIGVLGFGAGSSAKIMLEFYPQIVIHGWEIDPSVIDVGREFFNLSKLEKKHPNQLFIYIGNALKASIREGFSGILVDLFSQGSLIPELQDPLTWQNLKKKLKKGGRIMANVGGSCVEAEDSRRNGKVVMEETLKAMYEVFPDQLYVLKLGNRQDDSAIALTGDKMDLIAWKKALPKSLRGYAEMWIPFDGSIC
ncbi:putative polyamine aminopropyl transferase [Bienertia sinuspersici]